MSWRDRSLLSGTFRGVKFYFESIENEIGRRTVVKEFPGRDQPNIEDLGRRTRRITIDMFVVGPDYDLDRDQLREALETPGSGTLEHPYWGTLTVTVDGPVKVRETTREGGMARFSVTFVEAGKDFELALVQIPDTAAQVLAAAEKLESVGASQFAAVFNTLNTIAEIAEEAVELVNSVASTLNSVRGKIAAAMQVVNDLKAAIDSVVDTATDLINTPITLANTIFSLYNSVVSGISEISDAFESLQEFFGGESGVPSAGNILTSTTRTDLLNKTVDELGAFGDDLQAFPEVTVTQQLRMENQRQLVRLAKVAGATSASKVLADLNFDNVDQALLTRETMTRLLDSLIIDENLSDELYGPLVDLRAAVIKHLNSVSAALPQLDDYVPQSTVPALLIAYQLYGDSSREAEILLRNAQIRDPSAVASGQPIRVVVDE